MPRWEVDGQGKKEERRGKRHVDNIKREGRNATRPEGRKVALSEGRSRKEGRKEGRKEVAHLFIKGLSSIVRPPPSFQ